MRGREQTLHRMVDTTESMQRRDVLKLMSSGFLAGMSDASGASRNTQPLVETAATEGHGAAYGSGLFRQWITDEYGAPAYRYTCEQLHDPKALTPTDPIFCGPKDHWHQLGNDRLVVKASNFGYMQVRQDEGAPKFLNDYISYGR